MDERTRELYESMRATQESKGTIAYPQLLVECHVIEGGLMSFVIGNDIRADYLAYIDRHPQYAEWYRVLAYGIYGYGNWSNNDRRRHGLPARRSTKANRRKGLR